MSDSFWALAISVTGVPAGAIRRRGKAIALGSGNLPELIAEASGKAPLTEPTELILVHPKSMGVDEVGEWFAQLTELGVRARTVRTVADTEVLALARFGEGDSRDVVVGNTTTGEVYGRRGNTSGGHEPLAVAMPKMVTESGALGTWAVLVGSENGIRRYEPQFEGTHVRPSACTSEQLAMGALDPDELRRTFGGPARTGGAGAATGIADEWKGTKRNGNVLAAALLALLIAIPVGIWWVKNGDGGAVVRDQVSDAAEQFVGPGARPIPTPTPAPVTAAAPEPVPAGVDVPEAIGYYYDLFDPVPLLRALPDCHDGEARKYENVSFYCVGRGSDLNAFAAENGLPELARPDAHVSVHFDTHAYRPTRGTYDHECFITYDYLRDDIIDGAEVEVNEPCDPDDERYAGPWPEDEEAEVWIHDVRRVYVTDDGENHPLLRIDGLKDLVAVEAILRHYGLVR